MILSSCDLFQGQQEVSYLAHPAVQDQSLPLAVSSTDQGTTRNMQIGFIHWNKRFCCGEECALVTRVERATCVLPSLSLRAITRTSLCKTFHG